MLMTPGCWLSATLSQLKCYGIYGEFATLQNPIHKIQEGWYAWARNSLTRVVEYQEEPKPLWSDVERAGGAQKLGPRWEFSKTNIFLGCLLDTWSTPLID